MFHVLPDTKPKSCVYPTPTPDTSQWNIGGVRPSGVGAGVGHVHFIFLCRFHLRLVVNANPVSSGIWAVKSDSPCPTALVSQPPFEDGPWLPLLHYPFLVPGY